MPRKRTRPYSVVNESGVWYLHRVRVQLVNGPRWNHFFSREIDPDRAVERVPAGFEVRTGSNGLPLLGRCGSDKGGSSLLD